ncbi:MAG: hypothetical protein A2042_03765 [Candidatus Schekmanbacteria bacterium GWA2_38_11]|uniref:Uncharacterized protein n=1 Tax=Candidatus Schekmanbacteria bacterium GWA2_38_11 TaxID=1817876 RepID=A0A1F7RNC2_9BACT|nr:MAG: hypothetical protein A2042_03765 [Candidatus Schekmanbacteria bacterium GWA2_38_11]
MIKLKGKKVGNYNFTYTYKETKATHKIKEYYNEKDGVRMVILEKETRKGENFVKLPNSLWITRDGYPPLATDGAMKRVPGRTVSLFFAGLPTVQSQEHIRIFDDVLRNELKGIGLDYDQMSKAIKERDVAKEIQMTGFLYLKKEEIDENICDRFMPMVLKAYGKVLESDPMPCPVDLWRERIIGKQAIIEYHLFKDEGFDVPLSAQRAFFTMMIDEREASDEKTQEEKESSKKIQELI